MIAQGKFAAVIVILFLGAMGFWWWGLNDYRETASRVADLTVEMEKMKAHVRETERVLRAVESIKTAIQNNRKETDAELANACRYSGSDRLDRIERLLEEDLSRRYGSGASGHSAGGLSGAGGSGKRTAGTSERGANR